MKENSLDRYCFFHNDLDGQCSAAILRKYYNKNITCIPVNYNMNFPFETLSVNDKVFIVDYSLSNAEEWEKLFSITSDITWIDHHKTAIQNNHLFSNLKGIRDIYKAGCVLTWEYLYPNTTPPKSVSLIGDYDIWKYEYGEETRNFQEGLMSFVDTNPESNFWDDVLISVDLDIERLNKSNNIIYDIISVGEKIRAKKDIMNKSILKSWSFEVDFLGYKCICINRGGINANFFNSVENQYDILISYVFDGEKYTVSLYHGKNKELDLGAIAKQYKGGGHKGAAGFQCTELPFSVIKKINT